MAKVRRFIGISACLVILGFFLLVSLYPVYFMASVSLMTTQQFFSSVLFPWPIQWSNYPDAWVRTRVGTLYFNSVFITTTSVLLTLLVCVPAGYSLARIRFLGREALFSFILVGLTLPVSISLIPLFFNLKALGLLNTPLSLIGPYTGFGISFGVFIMKGFFETLPRELEEAARIDGASEFRVFLEVMLPLTRPAIATVSIFLFLVDWNEFLFALTFVSDTARRTLPVGIYALLSSEFYGNYPTMAAALVIFSLPVLILFFLFQNQFIEGLTAGAVKQ